MPYQQAPPMQDTFVPSQAGTHSTNWFGENLQSNDGDLASMIRKPSSSEGFYGTPFLPNQSQSTHPMHSRNRHDEYGLRTRKSIGQRFASTVDPPATGPSAEWSEYRKLTQLSLITPKSFKKKFQAQSMKLYAVVLIVVAILALSAICEAVKHRENLNSIATNINNTRRIEALTAALRAQTADGGGTPNFQAPQIAQRSTNFTSGNPGSSNPNYAFPQASQIARQSTNFTSGNPGSSNPNYAFPQAPQIARQSSNFTSGNPGSSRSASEKGKSTNFSKASNSGNWPQFSSIRGSASHYGSATSYQQVPPVHDTVPSQGGTDATDWEKAEKAEKVELFSLIQ
uniref:Col_cuticle_N domain-containing protein n=1 Tax=Globodera pallida TaxID=36090 RepID=A0A183BZF7_GLOPA